MIAGNIENSVTDTPDDQTLNKDNEWLQYVQGHMPPKKPAIKTVKPRYPIRVSSKQQRGLKYS